MEAHLNMTGWVGTEVETRVTRTGFTTASFRLACTPRIRRQGDWSDGETTWLSVTCFRALAENVGSSVAKGDPVLVSGRLRTNAWTDPDGERHERLVLEATTVGHDLSRGRSVFTKTERSQPEDDVDEMVREGLMAVEDAARQEPAAAFA